MCYYFEIKPFLVNFDQFYAIFLVKITNICGQSPGDQRTQHFVVLVYPNIYPWTYIQTPSCVRKWVGVYSGGRIFRWVYIWTTFCVRNSTWTICEIHTTIPYSV